MRKLNENSKPYDYPIPLQDQHLDFVVGSHIFSSLDFRSGFWNIPLHESSRDLTGFSIPELGKFRLKRLPQGCSVSAELFAAILDHSSRNIRKLPENLAKNHCGGVSNYFDDISVYSDSFETHLVLLRRLFLRLRECNMSVNPSKSKFGYKKL